MPILRAGHPGGHGQEPQHGGGTGRLVVRSVAAPIVRVTGTSPQVPNTCLCFIRGVVHLCCSHLTEPGGVPTGNNYGLGETRKKELVGSCEALGIDSSRCLSLDEGELQDNPKVWWNEDVIQAITKKYVKKWDVDAVR